MTSEAAPTSFGHQNGGPAILAVCITTLALATVFTILRVFVRLRMTSSFWWDDGFLVAATALSITGAAFNILSVKYGAGKHAYDLTNPEVQVAKIVLWNTAYQVDNVITVNFVKVSILLFILRLQNSKKLAYIIWTVMAILSITNLITVAALLSQCRPLQKLWNPSIPGVCFYTGELSKFGYAQGVINILTDFFCAAMPGVIIWKVKIKTRVKILICGLTSLGLMATASQIVRVVLLNTLDAEDYSYQIIGIVISAILDQNLGIIAACIPTLRPIFKSFAVTFKSKATSNNSYKNLSGNPMPSAADQHKIRDHDRARSAAIISSGETFCRNSSDSGIPLQDTKPAFGTIVRHIQYDVESSPAPPPVSRR